MAEAVPKAGSKRPHSAIVVEQAPPKRRRVHHNLANVQHQPHDIEPAPQDPVFAQGQLLRGIAAALALAGFDSVKPGALEMFRSHTEEYMLKLLSYMKVSMHSARRPKPTAQDFSMAFSLMPNTSTASLLEPQLRLAIPEDLAYPSIPDLDLPLAPTPDYTKLLQPLIETQPPAYIPKHFPELPPRHAWMSTPVFPEREKDSRKVREKATQEGLMAEQALRTLATAAKAGALKAERRRSNALSGFGRVRTREAQGKVQHEDTFEDAMKDIGGLDGAEDMVVGEEGDVHADGVDVGMPEGVAVNYDMGNWRHGGSRKSVRT